MKTKLFLSIILAGLLIACDSYGPSNDNPSSVIIDSIKYTYYLKDARSNYATCFNKESYLVISLDIENQSAKNLMVSNNNKLGDCYEVLSGEKIEQLSIEPAEPDSAKPLYVQMLPHSTIRKTQLYFLKNVPSGKYYYQAPMEIIIDGNDTIKHTISLSLKFEIK